MQEMKGPILPLRGLPWGDPTVQGGGRELGHTACQLGGGRKAESVVLIPGSDFLSPEA